MTRLILNIGYYQLTFYIFGKIPNLYLFVFFPFLCISHVFLSSQLFLLLAAFFAPRFFFLSPFFFLLLFLFFQSSPTNFSSTLLVKTKKNFYSSIGDFLSSSKNSFTSQLSIFLLPGCCSLSVPSLIFLSIFHDKYTY